MTERELPMLAGIASIFHWLEELLNIINGPILMFGAGIALVDLLTDGSLTASAPMFLLAWALSQALGIDTQLLGCFARARHAASWGRAGWLVLGVILCYAAWQAGYVFAVQQSQHISEASALAQLGMSPSVWLGWRAGLAVGLVALSGWTRYVAPARESAGSERERLERELALEPLRVALRVRKAAGVRGIADALRGAPTPATAPTVPVVTRPEDDPEPEPPVPPHGRPDDNSEDADGDTQVGLTPYVAALHIMPNRTATAKRARGSVPRKPTRTDLLHDMAFDLLDRHPDMTGVALRRALGCNRGVSSKLHAEWRAGRRRLALVE